jgi:hypothetical protein
MNPEIIKMRNDLSLLRHKAAKLLEEGKGLITLIRGELPPYGDDAVQRAGIDEALKLAKRLKDVKCDLVKTQAGIAELMEALGENE